jgi:hypothetical protein
LPVVGGQRGPLDSIRRLGAMGRGCCDPCRRWGVEHEHGLYAVAVVPRAAVVCSQCGAVSSQKGRPERGVGRVAGGKECELRSSETFRHPRKKSLKKEKPPAVAVGQARRCSRAICCRSGRFFQEPRAKSREPSLSFVRVVKKRKECTTVHLFSRRMKITQRTRQTPRLEILHPRTVHIFSRHLRGPSGRGSPGGAPVPGVTSALKRRLTPGYSPTTPSGWYIHNQRELAQRMCTQRAQNFSICASQFSINAHRCIFFHAE